MPSATGDDDTAGAGHDDHSGHAHTDPAGPIAEAEAAAADLSTTEHPMGGLGKPLDRRSPFLIGMAAAAAMLLLAREILFPRLDRV